MCLKESSGYCIKNLERKHKRARGKRQRHKSGQEANPVRNPNSNGLV